jgi:hypothetical protein
MPQSGTCMHQKRCKPPKFAAKPLFLTTLRINPFVFSYLRQPLENITHLQ